MPIPPQFQSQKDLVKYLENLEQRIDALEAENQTYRDTLKDHLETGAPDLVNGFLNEKLPKTKLLSSNFLTRAFTLWAHWFTAQLLILAVILIVVLTGRIIFLAGGH